jgi:transcriptional regulator with XRE-family HTH domain
MNFFKILVELRKQKSLSQGDLADMSSVSREMISKYERNEAVPSLDAAKKLADALGVSLDYLVGEGINSKFDKKTLKRLNDIEKLDNDTKDKMFFFIDTVLRDSKAKQAYN